MNCLHNEEAATYEDDERGPFFVCAQDETCHFWCSEDDAVLYEQGIEAFMATNQQQPHCCKPNGVLTLAKLMIVKVPRKPLTPDPSSHVR